MILVATCPDLGFDIRDSFPEMLIVEAVALSITKGIATLTKRSQVKTA